MGFRGPTAGCAWVSINNALSTTRAAGIAYGVLRHFSDITDIEAPRDSLQNLKRNFEAFLANPMATTRTVWMRTTRA